MRAEGRWTIWRTRERGGERRFGVWEVDRPPVHYLPADLEVETVPVVPCDDAAVERAIEAAMTAIVESDDVIANGDEPFPGWALKLAERAIAAGFRAAGEVPHGV